MSLSVDSVDIKKKIVNCKTLQELEVIRLEYLGKKGLLPAEMKLLGKLPIDQKKIKGQELNKLKTFIEVSINDHKILIQNAELEQKLKNESIDVTLPHTEEISGKIHPISQTIFSITEIFGNLNYSVETGPDIESDFNNFSALNIPPHHPAREMQDTFYVNNSNGDDNVLRTHTSPVQVRTMLKSKPPIKIIVPGRTYRSDSDSTHTPMFHQVEGLVVNKDATMADLKSTLILFLKEFFEIDNLKYRFRPSYFPFTEPSAEMDVAYTKKNNVLKIGEGDDWLEILGCGMVNPKVLENCNIDSSMYQGFAFGMGIERLSMLKYGITDMRGLFDLNIKWLDHYGFSPLDLKTRSEI
jgi:phenylalanyl-tRNA synthetase alpha chain